MAVFIAADLYKRKKIYKRHCIDLQLVDVQYRHSIRMAPALLMQHQLFLNNLVEQFRFLAMVEYCLSLTASSVPADCSGPA